LNSKI